jgi:hypothetical protein
VVCAECHRAEEKLQARLALLAKSTLKARRKPLFSAALFDFPSQRLARCNSCHGDPHRGQLFPAKACADCHSLDSFHALTFDHDKDSRFPLTGAHQKVQCASCHTARRDRSGSFAQFRPLSSSCGSCHEDVHAGQFSVSGKGGDCARCHETGGFKPPRFEHRLPFTSYVLEGKHATVACDRCHPIVSAGTLSARKYAGLPRDCAGCHVDPHQGAFKGFQPLPTREGRP